jgi:SAM-dependent methyltransferase
MSEYIPKGYKVETIGTSGQESLVHEETGDYFLLKNRDFEEINHAFSNLPARAIMKLKKERGAEEPIRILDLGGGIEAKSAGDIAVNYGGEKDERIQVYNLDITARKKEQEGLHQIVGDALQIPLKDDSIDMGYSRQSVSLIAENNPQMLGVALEEAARVLKPGSVFFIDKTYTDGLDKNPDVNFLKELGPKLGVTFYSAELGLFLGPLERILNKLNRSYPNWKFIIMVKEPIDKDFIKSLRLKDKDRLI